FFFQAEDGIRDRNVTGVQTCALPILSKYLIEIMLLVKWVGRHAHHLSTLFPQTHQEVDLPHNTGRNDDKNFLPLGNDKSLLAPAQTFLHLLQSSFLLLNQRQYNVLGYANLLAFQRKKLSFLTLIFQHLPSLSLLYSHLDQIHHFLQLHHL